MLVCSSCLADFFLCCNIHGVFSEQLFKQRFWLAVKLNLNNGCVVSLYLHGLFAPSPERRREERVWRWLKTTTLGTPPKGTSIDLFSLSITKMPFWLPKMPFINIALCFSQSVLIYLPFVINRGKNDKGTLIGTLTTGYLIADGRLTNRWPLDKGSDENKFNSNSIFWSMFWLCYTLERGFDL